MTWKQEVTSEQKKQQGREGAQKDLQNYHRVSQRHVSSHLNLVIKVVYLVLANRRPFLHVIHGANWISPGNYLI